MYGFRRGWGYIGEPARWEFYPIVFQSYYDAALYRARVLEQDGSRWQIYYIDDEETD
jgi:hypothetical protein